MHFLITGHTGFKGAWMSLLLSQLGHTVSGLSLEPEVGSLFDTANLEQIFLRDMRGDVRELDTVRRAFSETKPDVVVHMAAQAIVLESYEKPVETFAINVDGTMNILKALSESPTVKAALIVTTDKVYENDGRLQGYVESDPLGAADPYSTSKAMADLLTQSWTKSFPGTPVTIARAGNVIGGGDINVSRLLPDILRKLRLNQTVSLRHPDAVRPWQHVLDCITGYYLAVERMLETGENLILNFGPDPKSFRTVREVTEGAQRYLGMKAEWVLSTNSLPEAGYLTLSSDKAQDLLDWRNELPFPECLSWTLDWAQESWAGQPNFEITLRQVQRYLAASKHLTNVRETQLIESEHQ